jgi:hypothetical protein
MRLSGDRPEEARKKNMALLPLSHDGWKNLILVITQSSDVDTTLLVPALTDRHGRVQVNIFDLEIDFSNVCSLRQNALTLRWAVTC